MASIHKDIPIAAPAHEVWDAVRDFGALHTRLVPGFVLDTRLDGDARIVSFANGTVARELLVDSDDTRQRLVYAVISERLTQHSARSRWSPIATHAAGCSGPSICCRTRLRHTSADKWMSRRRRCRRRSIAPPRERYALRACSRYVIFLTEPLA